MPSVRVADGAFELGSPCWTVAGGYESWCMAADAALKRVAGMLFASCFFLMLCVWADFVSAFATSRRRASTTYLLATAGGAGAAAASLNSSTGDYGKSDLLRKMRLPLALLGSLAVGAIVVYITLFCMLRENVPLLLSIDTGFMFSLSVLTCLIGVGVAFFGVRITLLARRYNPSSRLYIKILSLALLCSLLLVFKAVMWMAVTAHDENIGSRPLWRDIFNTVLTELIPAACMCAIFWPVPKPQARFPTSK